jgi:hypothetical protein
MGAPGDQSDSAFLWIVASYISGHNILRCRWIQHERLD